MTAVRLVVEGGGDHAADKVAEGAGVAGGAVHLTQLPLGPQLHAAFIRVALRLALQPERSAVVSLPALGACPVAVRRGVLRLAYGLGLGWASAKGLKPAFLAPPGDATDPKRGFAGKIWSLTGKRGAKLGVCLPAAKIDVTDSLDCLAAKYGLTLAPPYPTGLGLGAWVPGAVCLLVGDTPGPGWRGGRLPNWPFVSALRTGCSGWLADQLEAAGVGEHQLYWINAYGTDAEHTPTAPGFLLQLRPRVIVALGKNAERWVVEHAQPIPKLHDMTTYQVHHPQFWKRFHSHERYTLPRIVSRALRG